MLIRRLTLMWTAAALLCPAAATAQSPPSFEVASLKPTEHGRTNGLSISYDPATPSPGTFTVTNNSLDELIRWAYRVKEYQISGPNWLNDDSECFDIRAKMPPGTSDEQLRLMMQTLLRERFGLTIHHETKTLPVYELLVANGGPKLATATSGAKPGISYEGKFRARMSSGNASAADLASLLSGRLNRPVIDKTGIETHFAFSMEYRLDDNDTSHPDIFTAIQEKMGLKLQTAKGPVDILVIDHVGKVPSEN